MSRISWEEMIVGALAGLLELLWFISLHSLRVRSNACIRRMCSRQAASQFHSRARPRFEGRLCGAAR